MLTDSITSFFKNIVSRLKDLDIPERWNALPRSVDEAIQNPVLMAVAGLVLLLVFLWIFRSARKTFGARQRLNQLNKALSGDGSYGLGPLITQWGEEPRSTGYTKSSGSDVPPSPHPVLNGNPPAEKEIGFSSGTEEGKAEKEKDESTFSIAPATTAPVFQEEDTITFNEEPILRGARNNRGT